MYSLTLFNIFCSSFRKGEEVPNLHPTLLKISVKRFKF